MAYLILIPMIAANLGYWSPRPSDVNLIQSWAAVTEITETDVRGYLPTPCNQLRIDDSLEDIQVYSVIDPQSRCIQVLTPFEVRYK